MLLRPIKRKQRKDVSVSSEEYRTPLQVHKVIQLKNGDTYPVCPRCNCSLDREYMRFCDRCGQHLQWRYLHDAQIVYSLRSPMRQRQPAKRLIFKKPTEQEDLLRGNPP